MDKETYDQYQMQSDLASQQSEAQLSAYAPQMQEQVSQAQAVLVAQTNPDKILEEIELKLRGQRLKTDGSIDIISDPLMNKKGISRIIFIMSTVINQNTILSHLEDREISKLIIEIGTDLDLDLALNWRDYGVKDRTMLNHIEKAVVIPAFFALKRALGQNEKNWLGKITLESISGRSGIPSPKKEGFWTKFRL